jgi:glycosyltransferase involved in cell wall biosynthesis
MKLLVISHTPHYMEGGTPVGWGATVREIDHLATIFDEVTHVAPLYAEEAPQSSLAYQNSRVQLRTVRPAGGERVRDKLSILSVLPQYFSTILTELKTADVVHVRCPANIGLIAVLMLCVVTRARLRWIKYAGNWQPDGKEAMSYTVQRWLLRQRFHRGVVTVNGNWPQQENHVHTFYNPCLTARELAEGQAAAASKQLSLPLRIVYVGRLENAKGVNRILQIASQLSEQRVPFLIDLVGDGPERHVYEKIVKEQELADYINFHGWLPRDDVGSLYAQAHFMLFPSNSEGWPKVLSEAMAYGVVPISSDVSSIPQYLKTFNTGKTLAPTDVEGFTKAVKWYAEHPQVWAAESQNGVDGARSFSYAYYLDAVRSLLKLEGEYVYEPNGVASFQ